MRYFLVLLLTITVSCKSNSYKDYEVKELKLGPMVGYTSSSTVNIWVQSEKEPAAIVLNGKTYKATKLTDTIKISGLNPATEYEYFAVFGKKKTPVYKFKTAVKEGSKSRIRFMFSSCSGHVAKLEAPSWMELAKRKDLNLILQLGDNHYGDTTTPAKLKKKYLDHRSSPGYRLATAQIPTMGIWDDHDFGPNNSDKTVKGKADTLRVYKEYWPNKSFGEKDNKGIYFSFVQGEVEFFMLDVRYHRDPNKGLKHTDPKKTILGKKQMEWLKKGLKNSKAKIKIIASGSEFQLNGHIDSWSSFKREQKEFLDFVKTIDGTILISGDRHFTGAYQIRGESIEITSGPLGSRRYGGRNVDDMFINKYSGLMYSVLDIDTSGKTPKVILEIYQVGKGMIVKRELTWDEINGKTRIKPLNGKN